MNTLYPILLYLLGVLGLSKNLRSGVITKVIEGAELLGKAGDTLKVDFLEAVFPKATNKLTEPKVLQDAFSGVFLGINKGFESIVSSLRKHATDIIERIEPDEKLKAWRVFGYLFQLVFLCVFAYADLIQLVNNLAVILPQDIENNPLLNNLTLAVLITSIGSAMAASFIIADFAGITSFGRWNEIQSKLLKGVVHFLTWFAVLLTLLIDVVIAVARITASPDVAVLLPQETSNMLIVAANVAQSLIIVPLLIITFLFLGGIVGIAVLYVVIIWVVALLVQLVHLILIGLLWLLVFGVAYLFEVLIRTVLWLATAILFVLGWIFFGFGETLVKLLEVAQKLLDIAYFPMDAIVDWIASYLKKNTAKQNKMTA